MQHKANKHVYQIFSCIRSVKAIHKLTKFEYCHVRKQQNHHSLFCNTLKWFFLYFFTKSGLFCSF